jgi:hypothetical protein
MASEQPSDKRDRRTDEEFALSFLHPMTMNTPEVRELAERLLARAAPSATQPRNEWQEAVIDALIVNHIYRKEHDSDPRKALNELLAWEQSVALDPKVSAEAEALVEQGRKEAASSIEPSSPLLPGLLEAERIMRAVGYDEEDLVMMRLLAHIETQRTFPSAKQESKDG